MSEPKKQHFIPQFLLRRFAHGKKGKDKLWVFDKSVGRSYMSNVKDAAHENRFYDGKNLDGKEVEAESLMGYVDGIGANCIKDILEKEVLSHDGKTTSHISHFVAAQMCRVPSVRNSMEFLRQHMISRWGPDVRSGEDERGIGEYSADDSKFSSITSLQNVPEYAKLLQTKIWFLIRAPDDATFFLSDDPVVKHNYLDYGPRGSLGLAQKGIEVYFPLSPKLALQFTCPEIAKRIAATAMGRTMIASQRIGKAYLMHSQNVVFINSLQVIHSERFLYGSRETDFALAKDMIREHPDLAKPASSKIIAS